MHPDCERPLEVPDLLDAPFVSLGVSSANLNAQPECKKPCSMSMAANDNDARPLSIHAPGCFRAGRRGLGDSRRSLIIIMIGKTQIHDARVRGRGVQHFRGRPPGGALQGAPWEGAPWEGEAPIANECSTIYFSLVLFAA